MELWVDLLRGVTTGLFVGLSAMSLVVWRRRRDAPPRGGRRRVSRCPRSSPGRACQALRTLVTATGPDGVARLLPPLIRVVGGRGATLLDDDGHVLAAHGAPSGGAAGEGWVDFLMRSGWLSVWVSPYTPFFGQDKPQWVRAPARLLDLAWERTRLADAQRQVQQALDLEREFSRRLVHIASDCIVGFDEQFRFTLWNPAIEELTGVPASDVLGRVALERFPSLLESGDDQFLRAALEGLHVSTSERHFQCAGDWSDRLVHRLLRLC